MLYLKGVFKCLSANLALQKFLLAINFPFTRTTKRLQPVTATRIFPPRAMQSATKFVYCFLLPSWQLRRLSYQAPVLHEVFNLLWVSRHIYTGDIPEKLSVYAYTISRPGSGPDSSQHVKLSSAKALLRLFFQCRRNFNFMACFKVIILKNRIERTF